MIIWFHSISNRILKLHQEYVDRMCLRYLIMINFVCCTPNVMTKVITKLLGIWTRIACRWKTADLAQFWFVHTIHINEICLLNSQLVTFFFNFTSYKFCTGKNVFRQYSKSVYVSIKMCIFFICLHIRYSDFLELPTILLNWATLLWLFHFIWLAWRSAYNLQISLNLRISCHAANHILAFWNTDW